MRNKFLLFIRILDNGNLFLTSLGFPGISDGKESACNAGDLRSIFGSEDPGGGNCYPLQCSCLENSIERGGLVGYNPWGCKESDMTD